MYHDLKQQTQGIDQDVSLAAIHLLAAVVPMRAALFGGLDRLAIDDRGAGSRLASSRATHALTQDAVYALPDAGEAPRVKIVIDSGPRPILLRQIAPGAARPQEIEDAIENPTKVDTTGTPTWLGAWEQGFEQGPFAIVEVTGIDT